jgi:hypothetical protein
MRAKCYLAVLVVLLGGEVMADSGKVIAQIELLYSMIQENSYTEEKNEKIFSDIKREISSEIPDSIKVVLANNEFRLESYSLLFLGYSVLDVKLLADSYSRKGEGFGYFGAYEVDASFNVSDGQQILIYEDQNGSLPEPIEITNLSSFLPVFSFQGDYIVANLTQDKSGELLVITDGYEAVILAPSIKEHLDDLLLGLKSGRYHFVDGEIIYPSSWYLRKKVVRGEIEIDQEGELIELKGS